MVSYPDVLLSHIVFLSPVCLKLQTQQALQKAIGYQAVGFLKTARAHKQALKPLSTSSKN